MIQEFLNDANQVQQAELEKGSEYATEICLSQLHKQQQVKNYQAELVFNEDDEVIEKSPQRSQDSNDPN